MDAALYVKEQANSFDVIIVDSSDPVGSVSCVWLIRSCGEFVHELVLQHNEVGSARGRHHLHTGVACTRV